MVNLPRLSNFQLEDRVAMFAAMDELMVEVENQITELEAIVLTVANMESDDVLTPVEKSNWVFQHSFLTGEQAGLDAQATSYGITTEKDAYDDAIDALVAYLATLTTPVAWNDFSGNTDIVGADFRTYFSDVLTAKQALIDAIAAKAKVLADTAQSTANTANTTATTAKNNDKLSASWTSPSAILTGEDTGGGTARIVITTHNRKYGDGTTVLSVSGGPITGLANSTEYHVYYDEPNFTGGAKTFFATTNPNTAAANVSTGRHYCGSVTTPAGGAPASSGGGPKPPAYTGTGSIP